MAVTTASRRQCPLQAFRKVSCLELETGRNLWEQALECAEWSSWMGPGRAQPQTAHPVHVPTSALLSFHVLLTPGSCSLICQLFSTRHQAVVISAFPQLSSPSTVCVSAYSLQLESLAFLCIESHFVISCPIFSKLPRSLPICFPPSSLVPFAAPPRLLSSADLISVVDDPSLPDRRLRGGMGGARQGRLHSSMCAQGHGCGRACFGCMEGTCSKRGSHLI